MDAAAIGTRLASSVVGPLVRKLFVAEGPGAGLVDKPVRLAGYVSFTGEKRTLTRADLRKLAAELVRQALRTGERPLPADEVEAVVDALTTTLYALGDLTLNDVEAVELGHIALARRLRRESGGPECHLSADATYFYERLLDTTCLHILHFFTQRSTFVAATLVAQSRRQGELVARLDELVARHPLPGAQDAAFERRYLAYVAKRHSKLTIFGIDLSDSPGRWPLDAAYLSLEATGRSETPTSAYAATQEAGGWVPPSSIAAEEALRAAADRLPTTATAPRPADQALAAHARVLLRGEAGSGKTTLVQWLAVSAARQELDERMAYLRDRVPFVLPLRTLTRHGERLPAPKDFLSAVGSPLAGEQPAGWEARVLAAGRALVLVDGIDEIPDTERARTRAWLTDLIDAYPGNRWLVTSRPSAVREDWLADEDFTELTLSSMRPADVAAFIGRWHTAARTGSPDEDAALGGYEHQLLAAVRAKADLGRLATNPLMCGLICALHRDRRGFLPLGRKDLYTAALSMLLVRRDRERDMDVPELREEPQIQLLQRLAYWLIRNGRTQMDRSRAESVIADSLPAVPEMAAVGDARAVFDHFLHRSGLLRQPAPGTVEFVHRTFQDFLGARAAVDEGDFGVLVRHAADDQWEDVVRMSVAHARPRERAEFFTGLLAYGDSRADPPGRARVHLLAAACLEHAAELDPAVRRQVESRASALIPPADAPSARELAAAGPVILDLLPGPEAVGDDEAALVVVAASHVGSDAAIPFLARFRAHPANAVRSQLVWSWGRFDTEQYADEVIAHLDPRGLFFTVTSDAQLTALTRLGGRPWLEARGDLAADGLGAYARTAALESVRIRDNENLTSLAFLRGQEGLRHLDISDCPALTDLSALEGTRLTSLYLDDVRRGDLGVLSSLSGLTTVRLGGAGLPPVSGLSAAAPLTDVNLKPASPLPGGLEGLGRLRRLQVLTLGKHGGPQGAADWREIALLPDLRLLHLYAAFLASAPDSLTAPSVQQLILRGDLPPGVGRAVTRLFPSLHTLTVTSPGEHLVVPELAALPGLRRICVPFGDRGGRLQGLDVLGPAVEVTGLGAVTVD
ncbi:NACHT domain-containing protein [Streptomyces albidochromogenes]|uniref:NACHT domain-containing protein n=3 Tax=Streptomyces albidochromogenes TaxID=329524 RepID=UPI0031D99E53